MNCKQGDIAIVVRSYAGNEGKIVRCLRLLPDGTHGFSTAHGPIWEIDTPLKSLLGPKYRITHDSFLRPIRDQPGADETLTWVPKHEPTKETA